MQRVVSVSSPTTAFPLLPAEPAVTNGATFGLGSDEGLGGALLTPIPWLVAGDAEGRALSPEEGDGEVVVEKRAKTPPPLGAEDVGKQPEGTRFGDPPRSEDEIVEKEKEEVVGGELEKEEEVGGKEEEMLDAGEEEMRDAGEEEEKEKKKEKE